MTTIASAAAALTHKAGNHSTQDASSAFGAFTDALGASSASDPTADPTTAQPLANQLQSLLLQLQSGVSGQSTASANGSDSSTQPSVLAQLQQTLTQTLQNYGSPNAALPDASLMV